MKILTRPFVLRLAVALLTFKIGVMATIMLGHFNPLGGRHARRPRAHRCVGERQQLWTPQPAPLPAPATPLLPHVIYPVYRPEVTFGKTARHSKPPTQPMLPSFEDEGEIKSAAAAPTHRSP